MNDEKGVGKIDTEFEQKKDKVVEFPVFDFFKINFLSFVVPLYICLGLFLLFEYCFIIPLSIPLAIHLLIFPGFLFLLYFLYLILLIEFTALWVRIWNKKAPPAEGVFKRVLEDKDSKDGKMIKYYHKRGFIIKFPMWLTSKSPFPWLVNRVLRRVSHNNLGKNVIYCDAYVGLEFTDIGDNVFIYPTSALSSHAVNTIFGKISIMKIIMGKNTTLYPGIIMGPNAVTTDNNVIFPNTVLHKNWRGKPGKLYYQGSPGRPIETSHIDE